MSFHAMFALVGWAKTASSVFRKERFMRRWYQNPVPTAAQLDSDAKPF